MFLMEQHPCTEKKTEVNKKREKKSFHIFLLTFSPKNIEIDWSFIHDTLMLYKKNSNLAVSLCGTVTLH